VTAVIRRKIHSFAIALAIGLLASGSAAAEGARHHIVIQVDQNDKAVMDLALNNARNVIESYRDRHEDADVEIVAYGPGLAMLRDDTSPVKDRIKQLREVSFPSNLTFSACNNTKQAMEKREGHPIAIIPQAGLVPAGVVRIMELQEQGWSYVRP
jgi:intracellular sulfur oxidation DsrE/DsrF family protein